MTDSPPNNTARVLAVAREQLAELEEQERAAIAAGDAETAADRRGQRLLMEEAMLSVQQGRAGVDAKWSEMRRHIAAMVREEAAGAQTAGPERKAGRPKGRTHSSTAIVMAYRALKAELKRRPTQRELAENLDPRIEVSTLKDHLRDYGLPWPIE